DTAVGVGDWERIRDPASLARRSTRQQQDGRGIGGSLGYAGVAVLRARAALYGAHTQLLGVVHPGIAVGHIDQRSLGSRQDGADPDRGAGLDQPICWKTEQVLHALLLQNPRDRSVSKHDRSISLRSLAHPAITSARHDQTLPRTASLPPARP